MTPSAFEQFHNDLKAALVARVPIEIGTSESVLSRDRLTEAKLDHYKDLMLPRLGDETSLDSVIAAQPDLPRRYGAALQVFERTGSMLPVLDGLTTRILAKRQLGRILRWALVYLFLLLLVAYWGLSVYSSNVVPAFNDLRADLILPPAIQTTERFDASPWLPTIVPILGVCMVLLLIWLLLGGSARLAYWLGGRQFLNSRTASDAIRTLRLLVDSGLPVDEAVSLSCDLTGADRTVQGIIRSAVQDSVDDRYLETLVNYQSVSANQRLEYLKIATPVALVAVVGGGIALSYCVLIFWPIVSLIKDLPTAGI